MCAKEADDFQRAFSSHVEGSCDDDVCDVRIHAAAEGKQATGELVLRESCPVEPSGAIHELDIHEILSSGERRLPCSVGEALATSQRLDVPALVDVTYLFAAAKNCLDGALLEGVVCKEDGDEACDLELWELSERLAFPRTDDASLGALLRELDAFVWYWLLHAIPRTEANAASFSSFREKYFRWGRRALPDL